MASPVLLLSAAGHKLVARFLKGLAADRVHLVQPPERRDAEKDPAADQQQRAGRGGLRPRTLSHGGWTWPVQLLLGNLLYRLVSLARQIYGIDPAGNVNLDRRRL